MKHGLKITALAVVAIFAIASGLGAQETKLSGYLLGAAPAGMNDVVNALNVKLKKDMNVSTTINYIGWGELASKYPLVLAAGQDIDWIYAATWAPFPAAAVRGGFKELTPDMLKKYMPNHYAKLPPEAWEQTKVNGKIYMIPTSAPDKKIYIAVIRGDLRKKYGIAPITNIKDLEPYLAAVKKNEPGIIPINLGNGYDLGQPIFGLMNNFVPPYVMLSGPFYGNYEDANRPVYSLLDEPMKSGYLKAAKIIKTWYDKGYLNKTPFSNQVLSRFSFAEGKSAVGFGNSIDMQEVIGKAKDQGFDPEIVPLLSSTGRSMADTYAGNGVAIAASSKNVEKTLQFLDTIMEQPDYVNLVYLGVQGKNYIINDKGRVALPAGVKAEDNDYPIDASGFWFVNRDIIPPLASWTDDYVNLKAKIKGMLVTSTFNSFNFVPDKVKTELASVTNVLSQYSDPINIGAVPDVDKAFDTLTQKLKAAGSDKILAEIKRQLAATPK